MATIRDNELQLAIANGPGIGFMQFDMRGHAITSGQPWEGISSIDCKSGVGTMHVKAGRKGSKSVAEWFKEKVAGGNASAGVSCSLEHPGELNFAFIGTLMLEQSGGNIYVGENIVIAQGHTGIPVANNWWIGGPNMSLVVEPTFIGFPPMPAVIGEVYQSFTKNDSAPAVVKFVPNGDKLVISITGG